MHVFPFDHGKGGTLTGREAARAQYTSVCAHMPANVMAVGRLVIRRCDDGATILAEFNMDLEHVVIGTLFTLATILVARVRGGLIQSGRDRTNDMVIAQAFRRR